MRYDVNSLDYFSLLKEAATLRLPADAKVIRIAILADCATQHLTALMKTLAAKNNVSLEVYEGDYDGIDLEILDPHSSSTRSSRSF